ncbi:hypothetical protein SLS56_011971 [Neofusicoccum ribis]|uniref:Metallo-beta-lactamase domain-containing protein n=1 Tax=Neofusicoccum ribis TaxID=45134 RepID=A0ABR3SAT8_9PEZI
MPLKTYHHISSIKGLSSVTTLIVGPNNSILIDPPFLIQDAESVLTWIHTVAPCTNLAAVFVTHHHPDHYFSANPILEDFQSAEFLAAPYVCAGIEREYDEKVQFWPAIYDKENFSPRAPAKPAPAEEIETPAVHAAWSSTLDLIESLNPAKVIPGHINKGREFKESIEHSRKYLNLFKEKIQQVQSKPPVDEIYKTFEDAFPEADNNSDFFLNHLSNQFGEGGKIWEENKHHGTAEKNREELEGWRFPLPKA